MATMRFGLPINMLDNFEAERAEQDWNGFPVPLVAHDYAVQIAEAVGDPLPDPYEGVRPYDGLCWEIVCAECGMVHTAEHECESPYLRAFPPVTSIESQVYIDGGVAALRAYPAGGGTMTATAVQRPPQVRLYDDEGIIDGFAGGGGTSTGIEMAIGRSPDVAINHDAIALAMHEANHPTTHHIKSNIRLVDYRTALPRETRCGLAWFSPDCTHHSKARGGKPFRDPQRARRIRGLAWEAVRCAKALHEQGRAPRVIILENVEEWRDWCPLKDGQPDWSRKGENYRRWRRELAKAGPGYVIEDRELLACDFGAPTARKRLFVIARCDGLPIVWPEPTHGPGRALPFRTAAECLDFSLPVPSIFLTPKQARAWATAHGLSAAQAPRRPLATATKRRIARGIQRFVLDAVEPFIVNQVAPSNEALVTPFLAKFHGAHDGRDDEARGQHLAEPLRTLDTSNRFVLVAPTLINTRNGERKGQAPRVHDIREPFNTITAHGSQGALVAAFLAKHNAGHEATGQRLERPIDTVTTQDSKALVTSHLLKLRGGIEDHPQTAQDLRQPAPTLTAGGTHYAEVRAFLVKYYGTKKDGRPVDVPLDTITTKERYGLVTVTIAGEEYAIVDIGMRMLTPRELFRCQGFPASYEITTVPFETPLGLKTTQTLTKKAQTRLVGNSVPPHVAAALIAANLGTARTA